MTSWPALRDIIEVGGAKIKDILRSFVCLGIGVKCGTSSETKRLPAPDLICITVIAPMRGLAIDVEAMSDVHRIKMTPSIPTVRIDIYVHRVGGT